MDSADMADEQEQFLKDKRIEQIRANTDTQVRAPKGACYFCSEPLPMTLAFCDDDCKDDFARLQRVNRFKRG